MNTLINTKQEFDLDKIECPYIKKAFSSCIDNLTMLTVQEFIQKSNFPIDNFMVDNFFNNLNNDVPIYITNELIEWCGFNAKEFRFKKREFDRMLEQFDEGKDYWVYSNREYIQHYEHSMCQDRNIENDQTGQSKYNYPHPDKFVGKNKTKHLILTVQCFKMALMMLNTAKAHSIRLYYISLEQLIKTYAKYQMYNLMNKNQILEIADKEHRNNVKRLENTLLRMEGTISEMKETIELTQETLDEVNDKFERATDERAPRTCDTTKHESFALLKLNKPDFQWIYYVLRCQSSVLKRSVRKMRVKFPQHSILLEISYQPNSKNLFNLVKENLGNQIVVKNNYVKLVDGYAELQFLQNIRDLNDAKKEVDTDEDSTDDE
jgi:hypothetical protein